MSVVTVQLGQCGNQIGAEFFRTVYDEACDNPAATSELTREVVQAVTRRTDASRWSYDTASAVCQQSGSGNNWARGYYAYGPQLHDECCEVLRREVERCDHLGGFMLMQSMAGGTGAGLGTRVAEMLREEYGNSFIMSHCIWPYESGEVIVQNYNTLLTLSHLLDATNGIIMVGNAGLHARVQKLHNVARPTFHDLNSVAAHALASALMPAYESGGASTGECRRALGMGGMVQHLCAHPVHGVLTLRTVPQMPAKSEEFTVFTWPALLKRMRQMLITGSILEEGFSWSPSLLPVRSVAALLTLRGKDCGAADATGLRERSLYTDWAVDPLKVVADPKPMAKYEKAAALLSNCQTFMPATEQMLANAYGMFASRAFTHQYTQQGMVLGDFEEAFAHVEDCLAHYRVL